MLNTLMILAALTTTAAQPVESFTATAGSRASVVADLLRAPPMTSAVQFVDVLSAGEQLEGWSRMDIGKAPIFIRGYDKGSGESIGYYFREDMPDGLPPTVCRIRVGTDFVTPARYVAVRWCFGKLGVTLPETPPSPVGNARPVVGGAPKPN